MNTFNKTPSKIGTIIIPTIGEANEAHREKDLSKTIYYKQSQDLNIDILAPKSECLSTMPCCFLHDQKPWVRLGLGTM